MSKNFFGDSVTLNSGYTMPYLGFGTWTLDDDAAEDCVYFALKVGYRLIDTARYYRNEVGVGRGIRWAIQDGIATREEIFVTSKIMPGNSPDAAINAAIRDLNLNYVDLMLIHWSGYNDAEVYRALERGVKSGKIRSIGISNYSTPRAFDKIKNIATIVPAVIQNENHPYYQNENLQAYVKNFGTIIEAWYPFGGRGNTQKIFSDATIKMLAKKYSKSPAQIILRWQIQAGYVAIPGSSNKNHIAENFNIFDFSLAAEDMNLIRVLNKNRSFENW
ncbi:MAG: aldo/keto reductase [Selenomonadaceae bacterium]|nr:aldo/keto reductase [Selenomonadaceae bacterium]